MGLLSYAFIGGTSAIVSRTLTAPLELSKIQQQNYFLPNTTLRQVIQKEGFRGLWKGNGVNCLRLFPQYSINYTVYSCSQKILPIQNTQQLHFCSAAIGGLVAISSVYPFETIRTRLALQTNHSQYKNLWDVGRKMSLRECYQGFRMTCIGYVLFNSLNFTFYETYKELFGKNDSILNKTLLGGCAGSSAICITYPSDLIRRRLQLQGFSSDVPKYNGILDVVHKIKSTDGMRGFYRGFGICLVKVFPTAAISFTVIEMLKIKLEV